MIAAHTLTMGVPRALATWYCRITLLVLLCAVSLLTGQIHPAFATEGENMTAIAAADTDTDALNAKKDLLTEAQPKISNVFQDSDLRQALADVAEQAGTTIITDDTVRGSVSADLKDVPLDKALKLLLVSGGYAFTKIDDDYLVGLPDPSNPNFSRFCKREVVSLKYVTPREMMSMLAPSYGKYLSAVDVGTNSSSGRAGASMTAGTQVSYRITITAPQETIDEIKAEMAQLDRPLPQVMLEASVIEISQEALQTLGVDWATRWLRQDLSSGGPNLVYSAIANNESAALTALVQEGRATLRANPRVTTSDGFTAELEVGKENYFEITSGRLNYEYSTLEKITSGILLQITPHVLQTENEVQVQVVPQVRDVTGKGDNDLPEITFRRASTMVRVRDGQSVVIGGLVNSFKQRQVKKVPLLGDIPLIGYIFRRTQTRETKTEVVILITPHILKDLSSTDGVQSSELKQEINPQKQAQKK